MASTTATADSGGSLLANATTNFRQYALRLIALLLIDAFALFYLLPRLWGDGEWPLLAIFVVITLMLNVVYLRDDLIPMRWIAPGFALLILMVAYPILFTVYTAFTNYGDGNLLTKVQAVDQIEDRVYLPEDALSFAWTGYRNEAGDYALWLAPQEAEAGSPLFVTPGNPPQAVSGEAPAEFEGYTQLSTRERLGALSELGALEYGADGQIFQIDSARTAGRFEQQFVYDAEQDAMIDQQTGTVYRNAQGRFAAEDGSTLRPGFRVPVGVQNFTQLANSPALRGPFLTVFIWTLLFATLSAFSTFALGLFLAIMFDVPEMPLRRPIRSLFLLPYAIPAFIAVPIWVGLLNPNVGILSGGIESIFGFAPAWFSNPFWARAGIILVNLWMGFPYMFLICLGALQAIPKDMYEAADIDGAGPLRQFWNLTLPMLMITVGPLLVATFAFNFNNFVIIELYNEGGPPIPGTPTPAGYTDILVSYTFRVAFGSARGADYGYAAAITAVIFVILLVITFFQFRYTTMLEERSENV